MARLVAVLLLVVGSMTQSYAKIADALPTKPAFETIATQNIKQESDIWALALALMFEGGSTWEPDHGLWDIGRVIIRRASENRRMWGGKEIAGVVFKKAGGICQFSFACLPQNRWTPRQTEQWKKMLDHARDMLVHASSRMRDTDAQYYFEPNFTSDRMQCIFARSYVPVFESGRHVFFREPEDRAEAARIAHHRHAPCVRHAEAVQKAKAAALERARKIAAAKKAKAAKLAAKAKKAKLAKSNGKKRYAKR